MKLLPFRQSRRHSDEELDEWARHHDDPRSDEGSSLWAEASQNLELTEAELTTMWQRANKLIGNRAPADYGEFCAYGYIQGRLDGLESTTRREPTA